MLRKLVKVAGILCFWVFVFVVGLALFKFLNRPLEFTTIFKKSSNPVLSYEMKPNFSKILAHLNSKIIYSTNSQGFRGGDFSIIKDFGRNRIVVLGDSVAFGIGVSFEQTFSKQLEKILRRNGRDVEVWNFGVVGYNGEQELELWEKTVSKYQPDNVILVYSLNDAASEKDWEYKPFEKRIGLKTTLEMSESEEMGLYEKIYGETSASWNYRQRYISQLQSSVEKSGARFFMISAPLAIQIKTQRSFWVPQKALADFAKTFDINYVDLLPDLVRSDFSSKEIFLDESHLNSLGNYIVATVLAFRLDKDDKK